VFVLVFAAGVLAGAPAGAAHGGAVVEALEQGDVYVRGAPAAGLAKAAKEARRDRYPIKVAAIWTAAELDEFGSYWRRPQAYAEFLGRLLASSHRGVVLVAMPNGFGVYHDGKNVSEQRHVLRSVRLRTGPQGLAHSAAEAVRRLAAASPKGTSSPWDRILIGLGAAFVLVLLVAAGRSRHRLREGRRLQA
jgi:hypothetical protein